VKTTPLTATVKVAQLELAWLATLGFLPAGTLGSAAATLTLKGSLAAPQVDGVASVAGLAMGEYRDVGATVDLHALKQIEAHASARFGTHEALTADLLVAVDPMRLAKLTVAEWLEVPVTLQARLLPTNVNALVPSGAPLPGDDEPPFTAALAGRFDLRGTANAPEMHAHAVVDEVQVSGVPVGSLVFDADSLAGKTTFGSTFRSRASGSFLLEGATAGSLGASDLAKEGRALLVAKTPDAKPTFGEALSASVDAVLARSLDATVKADQFDLALLNGLLPGMREIEGRLDVALEKHGPLRSPQVSGHVTVKDGHAALVSLGEFGDVKLDLGLAFPKIDVRNFSGRSGGGSFALRAARSTPPSTRSRSCRTTRPARTSPSGPTRPRSPSATGW
jgi:hypothetical protein